MMDIRETFKQSMRRLAASVSVLTCLRDGRRHGVTATAVTSLCADPASVLICVNASASIAAPLVSGGAFCVNLLRSHQISVSAAFGGERKGDARFEVGDWAADTQGTPWLRNAQANLFCTLDGIMNYGTHKIIIGRVDSARFEENVDPLIYQDGRYVSTIPITSTQRV